MQVQTTTIELHRRVTPLARCPQCGETMVAAFASEFVDSGEIRHHWTCEDCGRHFSTTVGIQD